MTDYFGKTEPNWSPNRDVNTKTRKKDHLIKKHICTIWNLNYNHKTHIVHHCTLENWIEMDVKCDIICIFASKQQEKHITRILKIKPIWLRLEICNEFA